MLNAALCEKRGEGGEHSKAPELGPMGRSIAQAIRKEQTPPHRVAAVSCQLQGSHKPRWLSAANPLGPELTLPLKVD